MANDRVKGITIEIGGDTTGLSKALTGVNSQIKTTQSQLRDVERLLKLDPTNTELLRQKQKLLADAVNNTREKLESLKTAQEQAGEALKNGTISEKQYDALQREIVDTEQKLRNLEEQAKNSNAALVQIGAAGEKLQEIGGKATSAGKALIPVTGVLTAAGGASAKMAMDFEDAMAKVNTIADTTQVPLDELEKKIIELSDQTGVSSSEIAQNVYDAISAGQKTGDAVNFVANSTTLARAGFTSAGSALDILTTIMNAYGLEADEVTRVSDTLITTQNLGKTTVDQLASSMGKVIPTAKANGVALDQVATGYAIMTANGVATAETTTYMNSMLNELGKSGTKVSDIIKKKTGKSFKDLMDSGSSLADVLSIVSDDAKDQGLAFGDLWSSAEAGKAALILLGDSSEKFNGTLEQMRDCTGATEEAFGKLETKSYQAKKNINELKNDAISTGQSLLNTMVPIFEKISEKLKEFQEWFDSLNEKQREAIVVVGMLVAALGPFLIIVGQITTGIGGLMSGLSGLSGLLGVLGGAGGPILITTAALGGLALILHDAANYTSEYYDKAKVLTDQEQKNRDAVDELFASYEGLNQRREDANRNAETEAWKERELFAELQSITDENGNVVDAYRDRAQYILGELSQALGTEYEMTGNQIQNYKDLCENIDMLILKKQANALLDANQEAYTEALKNQTDASLQLYESQKNLEDAKTALNEAQRQEARYQMEINALNAENIRTGRDVTYETGILAQKMMEASDKAKGYEEKIEGLNDTYEKAKAQNQLYSEAISTNALLQSVAVSDSQQEITDALLKVTNGFLTSENANRDSLERQVKEYEEKYNLMREAVEVGGADISQTQLDSMARVVELSKQELEKLPEVTGQATSDAAKAVTQKKPEIENAGKDISGGIVKGVDAGKEEVLKSVSDLAKDSINEVKSEYKINSPSKVMKDIGENVDLGLKKGIEDHTGKVTETMNETASKTVSTAETELSKEIFVTIGGNITEGLSEGILSGESQVISAAQRICQDTVNAAKEQLGIHSPSTEFAYMGEMSGEGYIYGWQSKESEIKDVVNKLLETTWTEAGAKMEETVQEKMKPAVEELTGVFDTANLALLTLKDSSGNAIANVVDNMWKAQEAIQELQGKLEDTIDGQINMFEEFDGKSELTTEQLLENMQSQVTGTEEWAENLRILAERGIDQGLLQKMADMGPKGAGYVTTFSQMTDEELQKANELFAKTMTLPETTAESIMESYRIAGTMMGQGFGNGIQENAEVAANSAKEMAENAMKLLNEALGINSPPKAAFESGQFFTEGFSNGITEGTAQVMESVTQVATAATSALDEQLKQSGSITQTYQTSQVESWGTWAMNLAATITSTLSGISLNTTTQLAGMRSSIANETASVQSDWNLKWTAIENKHKITMENIKRLTTQTLQTVKALTKAETNTIKTDTITTANELVKGVETELKNLEPVVKEGYEPAISYIKGLIPQARGWSHDMMDEFIAGIRDRMDDLEDACRDVADTVSDYMHFTRPEKGPLRYYEEWMPHMMQGLAKGIKDNRNLVAEQIRNLAEDMSALQDRGGGKQPIYLNVRTVSVLDGKQVAESMDEILGGWY